MRQKLVISFLFLFLFVICISVFALKNDKGIGYIFSKNRQTVQNEKIYQKNLTEYQNLLTTLPKNKPESIIKAKEAYFKYFSLKDSIEDRDLGFKIFLDFYKAVIAKIQENLKINDTLNKGLFDAKGNLNRYRLGLRKGYYNANGIKIKASEGVFYPDISYNFLYEEFNKYLSSGWNEYIKFSAKESRVGFAEDDGIIISWDKMRRRIIFLEAFLNKHPDFAAKDEVQKKINNYLYFYFVGMGNTPIYVWNNADIRNGILKTEVKKSYETFISTDKNSKYYPIVFEYYKLLKKHNFKAGDYIYQFVERKGLDISST